MQLWAHQIQRLHPHYGVQRKAALHGMGSRKHSCSASVSNTSRSLDAVERGRAMLQLTWLCMTSSSVAAPRNGLLHLSIFCIDDVSSRGRVVAGQSEATYFLEPHESMACSSATRSHFSWQLFTLLELVLLAMANDILDSSVEGTVWNTICACPCSNRCKFRRAASLEDDGVTLLRRVQ